MGVVFIVLGLLVFGLIMVYSSSFIYAQDRTGDGWMFLKRQAAYAAAGCVGLVLASHLSPTLWKKWAFPTLISALALLALVWVPGIGARVGGAQRWLRLGPVQFQPAEWAKFATVIWMASFLDAQVESKSKAPTLGSQKSESGWLPHWIYSAWPLLPLFVLLLIQPDFGSVVILGCVVFTLALLAGAPAVKALAYLVPFAVGGGTLVATSQYRLNRVLTFLDPWRDPAGKGFQVIQSMVGFFEGGLWGVGLGNSKEKLFFLPEAHNDFIFAVIGEELGFVGVVAVLASFLYLGYRGLKIGWTALRDRFDRHSYFLATGLILVLLYQAFVNAAVAMGVLPTKGLNMPFISYGGTALVTDLWMVGVLLSVSKGPAK